MFWVIVLLVVGIIVIFVMSAFQQSSEQLKRTNDRMNRIRAEHDLDELWISPYDQSLLGFKFGRQTMLIGRIDWEKEYLFSEIAAVDVIKNGASITTTNRGSQLLGAAVGGVALGGIGLLAGALTGSKSTVDRIQEIKLKITVDDHVSPLHYISMLAWPDPKGLESGNAMVKLAIDQTDRLYAHILNGMRAAAKDVPMAHEVRPMLTTSTGDQVKQLWELHQAGALTLEEFQAQKARLIGLSS